MSKTMSVDDRTEKVIVACSDANGGPTMAAYYVSVTQGEYDNGDHYEIAKEKAMDDGYEGPFVCFDNSEHGEIAQIIPELKKPVRVPYYFQDGQIKSAVEGHVEFHGNGVELYVNGADSAVCFLESWDGDLRLVSYGDAQSDAPTHVEVLNGALGADL